MFSLLVGIEHSTKRQRRAADVNAITRAHCTDVGAMVDSIPATIFLAIGADSTGAMGTFAPLLSKVLGREYSFAPVLFGVASFNISLNTVYTWLT